MTRFNRTVAALALLWAPALVAQTTTSTGQKKVLSIEDYARWRTIDTAVLSADGKWAAYGVRFSNTLPTDAKPVLHVRSLAAAQDIEIPFATAPVFSPDSKWIAYQVEPPPPARGGRGAGAGDSSVAPPGVTPPAVPPTMPPTMPSPTMPADAASGRAGAPAPTPVRRWEVRELATGRVQAWQDVQSAAFSPTSSHLVLRRRAANAPAAATGGGFGGAGGPGGAPGGGGGVANTTAPRGADALLLELATGRTQFLGSIGDIAFNRRGDLLGYTVDAAVRDGNGLFVIELGSGRTTVLDNDSLRYSRLTWHDRGNGLAVLKGRDIDKMRERDNRLLVFGDVASLLNSAERDAAWLSPSRAPSFPKGFLISDRDRKSVV